VRITFLATINDLEIETCDIESAYLTTPAAGKFWRVTVTESRPDAGKRARIVRALHGLKSAGAAFRIG
jgi:hypothetical protein